MIWRADPVWKRLSVQPSWGKLLRELSLKQKVGLQVKYTPITGGYHCQVFSNDTAQRFICEGYGAHPLGAIRDALSLISPIHPTVRSLLLHALIDYLQEEIEKHGLLEGLRADR